MGGRPRQGRHPILDRLPRRPGRNASDAGRNKPPPRGAGVVQRPCAGETRGAVARGGANSGDTLLGPPSKQPRSAQRPPPAHRAAPQLVRAVQRWQRDTALDERGGADGSAGRAVGGEQEPAPPGKLTSLCGEPRKTETKKHREKTGPPVFFFSSSEERRSTTQKGRPTCIFLDGELLQLLEALNKKRRAARHSARRLAAAARHRSTKKHSANGFERV